MLVEVARKLEDVEQDGHALFRHDISRQVLDNDVGKVVELVLDVAVVLLKLVDGVAAARFALAQTFDVGENRLFLVLEMVFHLGLVVAEETLQDVLVALGARLGDAVKVLFDVGDALVEVVAVGGNQVRHEQAHVGVLQLLHRGQVAVVGIDVANQEEERIKSKKCADSHPSINYTKTKGKTCPRENNKTIVLSIVPEYVQKIIDGTKKYEYRTKVAKANINAIVIYCTAPVKKVVAKAQVIGILQDTPSALWDKTKDFSGASKEFFDKYFENKKIAYAYRLGKIEVYKKQKTLKEFGLSAAPQSFVYLKSQQH